MIHARHRAAPFLAAACALLLSCDCELVVEPAVCGNGYCDWDEWCDTCPSDCGPCAWCGDGWCGNGETCLSCPYDCGHCTGCGDGRCDGAETCLTCPTDCGSCSGCGDGLCDAPAESCESCPADCGGCSECGDGTCAATEYCASCPEDCGPCRGDASLALAWTISGAHAGRSVCESVGAATVQLLLDLDGDGASDFPYEFNCSAGSGQTPEDFTSGGRVVHAVVLLGDTGTVLAWGGGWRETLLAEGLNDLGTFDFDFTTDHDAALSFAWTLHYLPADGALCGVMGARTAALLIDETWDGEADEVVEFPCGPGYGSTGFVRDSGDTLACAFSLRDAAGAALATTDWGDGMMLLPGNNDLGEVNFIVGEWGPLEVDLSWAATAEGTSFGECGDPAPSVSVMGYLLCRDGLVGGECPPASLYDIVDIDVTPVACRALMSWDILDFGTYELVVDGRDEGGETAWGATCPGLVIDGHEPGSNAFDCRVPMLP
jgi:hypothetical protein